MKLFLRLLVLSCIGFSPTAIRGQDLSITSIQEFLPAPGILRNSITNLLAYGDSLWVGPYLNLTSDGGETWQVADVDSLWGTRNSTFSIDGEGKTIWVVLECR